VVILFTLFWKRFHGKAAAITVVAGILFTVFWISGGFEQHYKVTESKSEFLVNQNVINNSEYKNLEILEGRRFISVSKFEAAITEKLEESDDEKRVALITSSFTEKGVPARLTTFIFSLLTAIIATFVISPDRINRPSRP